MAPQRRTLVIGDVHGCLAELRELLERANLSEQDEIISVGDLVGKGPDSLGVLRWARSTPNLRCVQGNHEARLLQAWRAGKVPREKASDAETYRQLGNAFDESMRFVNDWPHYLNEPGLLVVHAGLDPAVPLLERQSPDDLLNIRTLRDGITPWYEEYHGEQLVVFGHWAKPKPVVRKNALGLDTGCVYGGTLTGVLLPERTLISVPARQRYRIKKDWPMPDLHP